MNANTISVTHLARQGLVAASLFAASLIAPGAGSLAGESGIAPPQHLRDTGLYVAGSMSEIRPENLPFTPQYPLWSDGAAKRRWLYLPPGTAIDASHPDAWEFPPGTRLWKEFSQGRPIETRYIERLADGSWRYAAYVWNTDGSDAVLAPSAGIAAAPAPSASGGAYEIPAEADCRACHEGAATPVLGASALQLSPDRDPLAANAVRPGDNDLDLHRLVARGWLRKLAPALLETPPRIKTSSPTARAALGYLHGNCGHCHNASDAAPPVGLRLAQDVAADGGNAEDVLRSMIGAPSRAQFIGLQAGAFAVVPGHADASVLALRMRSRNPQTQMPPLGTRIPDTEGLALIERWINHDLPLP